MIETSDFIKDQNIIGQEEINDFILAIDDLSPYLRPKEKEAMIRVIHGDTLQEIAKDFNLTPPAIHVMLRRLGKKKEIGKILKDLLLAR